MNSICEQAAATHGNKKQRVAGKTSIEMLHFLQENGKDIIPGAMNMEPDLLTHSIIKNKKIDRKLQAQIIANRLLYCNPLHCP